jgi:glyoxylase-like metal-dependent hydrolase (beta-lactamase superfamily II)
MPELHHDPSDSIILLRSIGFSFYQHPQHPSGAAEAGNERIAAAQYEEACQKTQRVQGRDDVAKDGDRLDGLEFIHVPGHCPGQVCIRVGDILLTADHVLPRTTPHQSPESITASTGLRHYLESLEKIGRLEGIRLCLGGHEEPFGGLRERVTAIRKDHESKLERIRSHLDEAGILTMDELSGRMYPWAEDWHELLAIEEVGAHVEYLYERGELAVANVEELESGAHPALVFRLRPGR